MTDAKDLLSGIIQKAIASQPSSAWDVGIFGTIKTLEIDNRGTVGEAFVAESLRALGHSITHNREKHVTRKHWDIKVDETIVLEIKTATLGNRGTFQHESLTPGRNYDGLVLVDIGPDDVYVTFAAHQALPWRKPNNKFTEKPKKMHVRPDGRFKWTLTLADVQDRRIQSLSDIDQGYNAMLFDLSKPEG